MVEMIGIVYRVLPEEKISDKLSKKSVVVDVQRDKWFEKLAIEFINEKINDIPKGLKEGDSVHVEFDVCGREWAKEGQAPRYFTSLRGNKIEKTTGNSDLPF